MKIRNHLHWFFYALFFLGCARQTSPTGGPKDSIPPTLIQSNPTDGQINFKSQQIELVFDETIILNNAKEELIITPDIRKQYEINAKKNRVVIKLTSELHDTTTYALNFREAVQDITEKNSPLDLKLAFSTGDYIDSLSLEGIVFDPLTSKEIKNATVAIYKQDTFNIFQHKPVYFSKSNEKGTYKIANLKPDNYRIYAFDDKNKNLIVDSKSELYGFLPDTIMLTSNLKFLDIAAIHLDARPLKLTSARPATTYFNIKTTKNLKTYTLTSEESETIYSSFGEDNANIRVYNNLIDQDSIPMHFVGFDSINNKIDTTLYLKFSQRTVKPEPFKVTASNFQVLGHKGILTGTLQFTKPVLQINYDSILYRLDSANVIKIQQTDITIDSIHNTLKVHKSFDKNLLTQKPSRNDLADKEARQKALNRATKSQPIRNQLYIAPHSFISIESDSSARIAQPVDPLTLETTGVIHVLIQTTEPNYIIQLLTKQNEVVQSKINTPAASFEDLTPGDYQIRVILDRDADQRWTPGNFLKNQEPEPIHFYKNEKGSLSVNIKANWELGPLLIKI
jgi:uncharacterized protein (DUF2141 family)